MVLSVTISDEEGQGFPRAGRAAPREIPWSSPASPRKTPSFPPLLLRLTQYGLNLSKKSSKLVRHNQVSWSTLLSTAAVQRSEMVKEKENKALTL